MQCLSKFQKDESPVDGRDFEINNLTYELAKLRKTMCKEIKLCRSFGGIVLTGSVRIDFFLNVNPPCKECLVSSMCVNKISYQNAFKINDPCDELFKFIKDNEIEIINIMDSSSTSGISHGSSGYSYSALGKSIYPSPAPVVPPPPPVSSGSVGVSKSKKYRKNFFDRFKGLTWSF